MQQKAFTLIELLVVVLIIGILAAVAVPQYQKAVEKSRLTEALSNIRSIENAIQLYLLENGYPSTQIQLLGDDNHILSVEIPTTNRSFSITYGGVAQTNYFRYNAYCQSDLCDISAERTNTEGTRAYRLFVRITSTGIKTYTCYPVKNFSIGEQVCALLQKQGWTKGDTWKS